MYCIKSAEKRRSKWQRTELLLSSAFIAEKSLGRRTIAAFIVVTDADANTKTKAERLYEPRSGRLALRYNGIMILGSATT